MDDDQGVKSRASAILFCAPKKVETPLEPVVKPGESQKYIGGIKVGQLASGQDGAQVALSRGNALRQGPHPGRRRDSLDQHDDARPCRRSICQSLNACL